MFRRRLDACRNAGISEDRFRLCFSQCHLCHRFMTQRTQEYHECPKLGDGAAPSDASINADMLLVNLDCYARGWGVSEAQFSHMFVQCMHCQLYMTRWAGLNHFCEDASIESKYSSHHISYHLIPDTIWQIKQQEIVKSEAKNTDESP